MRLVELLSGYIEELTSWATIIDEDECAVRLKWGKVQDVITEPGLYLNLPFVHSIMRGSAAINTISSGPVVSSGVVVEAACVYRISNPVTALMCYDDIDERIALEIQKITSENPTIGPVALKACLACAEDRFGVKIRQAYIISRGSPRLFHLSGIND